MGIDDGTIRMAPISRLENYYRHEPETASELLKDQPVHCMSLTIHEGKDLIQ